MTILFSRWIFSIVRASAGDIHALTIVVRGNHVRLHDFAVDGNREKLESRRGRIREGAAGLFRPGIGAGPGGRSPANRRSTRRRSQ